MPTDIEKHLIESSLEMVQMARNGSDSQANLDMWTMVYGPYRMPVPLMSTEVEELVQRIREGDREAIGELAESPAREVMQGAMGVLAKTLTLCCQWVDEQLGTESGDQMLDRVRKHFQD